MARHLHKIHRHTANLEPKSSKQGKVCIHNILNWRLSKVLIIITHSIWNNTNKVRSYLYFVCSCFWPFLPHCLSYTMHCHQVNSLLTISPILGVLQQDHSIWFPSSQWHLNMWVMLAYLFWSLLIPPPTVITMLVFWHPTQVAFCIIILCRKLSFSCH